MGNGDDAVAVGAASLAVGGVTTAAEADASDGVVGGQSGDPSSATAQQSVGGVPLRRTPSYLSVVLRSQELEAMEGAGGVEAGGMAGAPDETGASIEDLEHARFSLDRCRTTQAHPY